jgi:8-oxo-dGTP pyrophosphatase MutT (NUDIX family)
VIKHATADTYVFCRAEGRWRIGLVFHPLWNRWVTPGGHVEGYENTAEAALRELFEESGIRSADLILQAQEFIPAGFPDDRKLVPVPWMIVEMPIPGDNGLTEPHIHVDYQYLAVVEDLRFIPSVDPVFAWFTLEDLGNLYMFDDAKVTARSMFIYLAVNHQVERMV